MKISSTIVNRIKALFLEGSALANLTKAHFLEGSAPSLPLIVHVAHQTGAFAATTERRPPEMRFIKT